MKCLRAKDGYVVFKGKAVLPAECTSTTGKVILNLHYMECIELVPGYVIDSTVSSELAVDCQKGYFKSSGM